MAPRKKKPIQKKVSFEATPGRGYVPSVFGGMAWSGLANSYLTGKPLFTFQDVPLMMSDNHIQYGMNMLIGQFMKAKWAVNSPDPNVKAFVDKTVTKFWRKLAGEILHRYLPWGVGPAVLAFKTDDEGMVTLVGGRAVEPADVRPRIFSSGPDKGQYAGFDIISNGNFMTDTANEYVPAPHGFWFAGNERRGRLYDTSRLAGAYTPWLSKNGRGGGLQSREIYFRKAAYNPGVLHHPVGKVDPSDPDSPDAQDIAREIAEKNELGSTMIMPNTPNPGMDGKSSEKAWTWTPPGPANSTVPLLEYLDALDQEIMRGILMPPEVLDASDVGSGWSGRMIPRDALFGVVDAIKDPLFDAFDQQVLRHMVSQNYGEDARYELDPVPMDESVKQADAGNPTSMVGNGQEGDPNPAGMQGGDAAPPQQGGEGGGDPFELSVEPDQGGGGSANAGGLIPYVGKKGGHGKKNPKTGRIYYMGHDTPDHEYGCLLAPIDGPLKDACHKLLDSIPDDELAEDGREEDSHVTIRYGLHDDDHGPVLKAVEACGSLPFVPGPLSLFKKPDCDVLYVSCLNPEMWKKYHDALGHLPHTDTYDSFVPHLTIAYLKPGKGAKYAGKPLDGCCPALCQKLEYHTPGGATHTTPVWPGEDELEGMLSEKGTSFPYKSDPQIGQVDELGWQQGQSRSGNVKAIGFGEHAGRVEYGAEALKVLNIQQPQVGSSTTGRPEVDKQYPRGGIERRDMRNAGAGQSPEQIAKWAGEQQAKQQGQKPAPAPQSTQTQPKQRQPQPAAQQAAPPESLPMPGAASEAKPPQAGGASQQKDPNVWHSAMHKGHEAARAIATSNPKELTEKGVTFFRTAKGSVYARNKDGSTVRIKSDHTGSGHDPKDVGVKDPSHKTVYVPKDKASALSWAGLSGSDGKGVKGRVVIRDGKASMHTMNPKTGQWGATASGRDIPVSHEPKPGMSPLELFNPGSGGTGHAEHYMGVHAGNEISQQLSPEEGHALFQKATGTASQPQSPTPAPQPQPAGAGGQPPAPPSAPPDSPPPPDEPKEPQRFTPPEGWKPKYEVRYTDKNGQRVKRTVEFDPKSEDHQSDVNAMIASIRKDGGNRLSVKGDDLAKQFAEQQWKDKYAKSGPAAPKEAPADKPPVAQRLPHQDTPVPKEHLDWARSAATKHMPAFLQKAGIAENSPHFMKARAAFSKGVQQAMMNLHKSGNDAIKQRVILPNGKAVVMTLRRKMTASLSHSGEPVYAFEITF